MRFTLAAGRALLRHDWPLNVRELHHTLDVAAALADGDWIDLVHLPLAVAEAGPSSARNSQPPLPADPLREQLVAALVRHRGNVTEVAREFGKERVQVRRWMKRFGVDARSFRRSSLG